MRLTGSLSLLSAAGLACVLAACSGEPNSVPTGPSPFNLDAAEHHAPGHDGGGGSGGGGGGQDHGITLTFSGNITSAAQAASIDRDTKFTFKILAGADNGLSEFEDTFQLSLGVADLNDCVVDPAGADASDVIAHLDDAVQVRDRIVIQINKHTFPYKGIIYHNWDDDDNGMSYRTWLKESDLRPGFPVTVTKTPDADEYTFTDGSIVSWNTTTGVAMACPFTGSITVTVTR
jgi:hypothetical protein